MLLEYFIYNNESNCHLCETEFKFIEQVIVCRSLLSLTLNLVMDVIYKRPSLYESEERSTTRGRG